MNETGSRPLEQTLQPKRIRRGVYGLSGTLIFNDALSKYMAEVRIAFSPKNDNSYQLSPISVPLGPLCDKMNNEYRKFLMKPLAAVSEMPNSDTGDMCNLIEQVRQ